MDGVEGPYTVGIDVGGTKLAAGVVDRGGLLLTRVRRPTPKTDPLELRRAIVGVVAELRADHEVSAVGIGAAGFVSADRSRVHLSPHLEWGEEPVAELLAEEVGLPVVIENDANAAAWAEFRFGAGRGVQDQLLIALGTGIGGGLILGGKIYRGGHGMAAEFGHMGLVPDGLPCRCGRRGCLEQYASGNALVREARAAAARGEAEVLLAAAGGDLDAITGPLVTEIAENGDPAAIAAFATVGAALGRGLSALVAALDPTLVLIGGGVSVAGDLIRAPAEAALFADVAGGSRRPLPEVGLAALGNDAGVIGAAHLARKATKRRRR